MKDEKTGRQYNAGDDDFEDRAKGKVKDIRTEKLYANEGFSCAVEIAKKTYTKLSDGQQGSGIEVCVGDSSDMGSYYTWYPGCEGWTLKEIWEHTRILVKIPEHLKSVAA